MARRNSTITEQGKEFINHVCDTEGDKLLSGNNGPLPYSSDGSGNAVNKSKWVVDAKTKGVTGEKVTKDNLGESLIKWFEEAAYLYELDPNILAAQAYIESGFKLWWYDAGNTTKSGINGFTMTMVYNVIIDNFSNVTPEMTKNEIGNMTPNVEDAISPTSYQPVSGSEDTREIARRNRAALHQNIINNPKTMIKAQARYMRYLANNSDYLASTSLFCYKRSKKYLANTYSRAIQKCKKDLGTDKDSQNPKLKEGLDYVLKVFGVLGDKNNELEPFKRLGYKPKGYSFGYNVYSLKFDENDPLNSIPTIPHNPIFKTFGGDDLATYPNENFKPFEANKEESEQYNISEESLDNLTIARDKRYKFIYFPESKYFTTETKKIQIVLHHTVSGGKDEDVSGDVRWWRSKGERVATAFIVSRGGKIFQLFNTDYWAHHLGITDDFIDEMDTQMTNVYLNERSIGIEIDSWGGLIEYNDKWYPTLMDTEGDEQTFEPKDDESYLPIDNVQLYDDAHGYPNGFRGFYGFEKYTMDQINAVRDLILSLNDKFGDIDLTFKEDMWDINYDSDGEPKGSENGAKGVSKNALNGVRGIWTHVSYRDNKSDCHPQPELVRMLRDLSS